MPLGSSNGAAADPAGVSEVEVGEEGQEASCYRDEDKMDDCCGLNG